MAYSNNDILTFYELFQGNTQAYGVTEVGEIVEGKAQASSKLVYGEVTPAIIQRHLSGQTSIGIAPIRQDDTCRFGAIDIDDYKYNLQDVIDAIEDFHLPIVPCYSKSKKLHLYILFSQDTDAKDVQEICSWYARAFACNKKVEIFPKQKNTSSVNKFYSWINLPYFDANNKDNHRKMVTKEGLLELSDALSKMTERQLTLSEHKAFIKGLPFNDAPPCILSGILLRDIGPGQRNNWLYACGVYLRLKDENCDLKEQLLEVNHSLHSPLPDNELEVTIIKGFNRKSYFYNCAVLERCDKTICRQKEYGIESKMSTGLDYGDLTQYMTDPPYYEWIVNGQKLVFWNEQEILQQNKFRALCLRQLHLVPRKVPDDRWSKILTRACEHIEVKEGGEQAGDFTNGSTFFDLTCNYFNTSRKATNITQIQMGRIFEDTENNEYIFTAKSFKEYITLKHDFKVYSPVEIKYRLEQLGAYRAGNIWRIPVDSIPKIKQEEVLVDFAPKDDIGDF